jgi:alpha,alpha-trehalase
LHYIVVEGLERYGYHEQAKSVALKWLTTNVRWFENHGVFLEKYNVVNVEKRPLEGVYPSQTGFGWTNAIFTVFADKYL